MSYNLSSDDTQLIEGCLNGNQAAWEILVTRYERLIYATARRYNLAQAEAEDVFGRVCLILLQNLGGLRDRERLASWLITTASREALAVKRNLTSRPALPGEAVENSESEAADDKPLPEEIVLQLERHQQIRDCFNDLPERCRTLLWHLFYNPAEPSYTEIATELKVPVASIGPTRARCLDKLRNLLQKNL